MSSTLTARSPLTRSDRSCSLTGGSGLLLLGLCSGLGVGAGAGPYLGHLGQSVDLRLERDRKGGLVAHQPDVVVDGAGGIRRVSGLEVEQVAPKRARRRGRGIAHQQWTPVAARRQRGRRARVERTIA